MRSPGQPMRADDVHQLAEAQDVAVERLSGIVALPEGKDRRARMPGNRSAACRLAFQRELVQADEIAVGRGHEIDLEARRPQARPQIGAVEGGIPAARRS